MHPGISWLSCVVLVCGLGLPHAQAEASNSATGKSTRAKARKPPIDKGPAESRAERDKRLQRECKGKPNSGACEGYGS